MLNTSSESSLENAVPSYTNFGDMPLTVNLASISPPPVGVYDLSQEEDPIISSSSSSSCGLSLDFASDVAISPSSGSFAQSPSTAQQNTFADAPSESFRRHSVGPASAPERMVGQKTKRDGGDASEHNEDEHHYDYKNNIDDESYFTPSQASADHATKRRRAAGLEEAIVKATSAPARFTVPLPNIEHAHLEIDDDDGRSSISVSSSQSFALVSTPGSTTGSLVQVPSPLPSPLSPAPAPAQRRVRRRAGTRARRTKCEYCPKTFSRMQDAERHARSSCPDNPKKAGVPCPECGEILSRQDSAQRHWRGHENPQREPPDWASMRA
ncbi:hypothetical protein EI94DRAFT_840316 [Lactarius quietus]|nr:hypothetical protein EI94DRAFT_840316 [Lactarius quietus]